MVDLSVIRFIWGPGEWVRWSVHVRRGESVNQQDKSFLITFTVVMSVLVMITIAIFLASQMISLVSVEVDDGSRQRATAEDRIKPVARVAVADPSAKVAAAAQQSAKAATAAQQSPEEIYGSVCAACHDAGVLQAPKTGSKEDWEPRLAQGLDTLVSNAVNGIRAMPAKGGNPNLSEEDIRKAVVYMLGESDIEVDEAATAEASSAAPDTGLESIAVPPGAASAPEEAALPAAERATAPIGHIVSQVE